MRNGFIESLAVALVFAVPAIAAPNRKPKSLSAELSGKALSSYDTGKVLFERGDPATAHAKFKEAYEASRNPRLLWNMAACSLKQKQYVLAIHEAERHLEEGRGQLLPEQIEKAEAFLEELKGLVVEASFELTPSGAKLSVDGEPRSDAVEAKPLMLELAGR